MRELIEKELQKSSFKREKIHLLREFLQILILKILYDIKAFKHIAFTGGTALRILHQIQRYSEDLDFGLLDRLEFNFEDFQKGLSQKLSQYAFKFNLKSRTGVINAIEIRFDDLLYEFGLSDHREQKFMFKFELDSNPPNGAITENHFIHSDFVFMVKVFDLPSIFSGKLHAILFRKYVKARDYYDLFWFLTKNIKPNLTLFQNAVLQTENYKINPADWKRLVAQKLNDINLKDIQAGVRPFLKNSNDADLLQKESFSRLLEGQRIL